MTVFKCKICGGALEIDNAQSVATCEYCGTKQTLPKLDDERRANLYDRANHFRRNNEFDKAMGIYEQILNEDPTDAEAYWSLVLCRYGIEYVEDSTTRRRVPTVNRAQFTSIFDDEDYKSAIKHADASSREIYEAEAHAINEIQKGILAISQREEPFDVFICYKESDNNGRRTQDSVLATELYHELTREGFKVFFARITLEDKLGQEYEPYIFAALNSAKVMVVLGTKPEHFNAVWVKNEWSRYLSLIKNGARKTLIPAYRDMDPYNLPEEFSHLQAQDMSKLGFMQDLTRGIQKITVVQPAPAQPVAAAPKPQLSAESPVSDNDALLTRALLFLEDGDFKSADKYCEKVLDREPTSAKAYLYKLMIDLHVKKQEHLREVKKPFDGNGNYQKALRFADAELAKTLREYILHIKYKAAVAQMTDTKIEQEYRQIGEQLKALAGYKDADKLAKECFEKADKLHNLTIYEAACREFNKGTSSAMKKAEELFKQIPGYRDADAKAHECLEKSKELEARERRRTRILAISLCVVCCIAVIAAIAIGLYQGLVVNVEQDGVKYKKDGDTYTVVGVNGRPDAIIIASEVKGKPVVAIADKAFAGCSALESIEIPSSITRIGLSIFYECGSLTSISVESGNTVYQCVDNCLIDVEGKTLIAGCKNSIIPTDGSVVEIDDFAFSGCYLLTSITIPDVVKRIGRGAFYDCNLLRDITLPFVGETLNGTQNTHLGYIFGANFPGDNREYVPDSLKTVIVTGGTAVDDYSFYMCSSLSSVTIPESVTSIGVCAFQYCDKLARVVFENTSGWRSGVRDISVTNAATAATHLKSTYVYYSWERK